MPLPYNMTRIPTLESEAMLWLLNIRLSHLAAESVASDGGSWGVVYVAGQASYVGRTVINYLGLSKNGECSMMAVREENFNPDVVQMI